MVPNPKLDQLCADVASMIDQDFKEATKRAESVTVGILLGRYLDSVLVHSVPQSEALVEHRKAWRRSLGLGPLA